MKIAILGYKNKLVEPWDPDTINLGLPGSEECVVYASQELANRGHKVIVFMDPPQNSIWKSFRENHPTYLDSDVFYEKQDFFDIIICWRNFNYYQVCEKGKKVYNWLHDILPDPENSEKHISPPFNGTLLLSEYHKKTFDNFFMSGCNTVICGNGVLTSQFNNLQKFNKKNKYSMGYFSNYSRGLIVLLLLWDNIKARFPQAELHICYGRETWNTLSEERMKDIITLIEKNKNNGIIEHGKVGHQELANIMMETSIWTYPCINLSETFCITAVKAQLAGCIPVVNKLGALFETVSSLAPSLFHPFPINQKILPEYFSLLVNTIEMIENLPENEILLQRQKYCSFAEKYSWSNIIDIWENEFNKE